VVESEYRYYCTVHTFMVTLKLKHSLSSNNLYIQWIILELFTVDGSLGVAIQLG